VLYDQYDNAGANATSSQNFEAAFDAFDDELADDFVVTGAWNVTGVDVDGIYFNGPGPATSVNVRFYSNSASNLPDTLLASRLSQPVVDTAGDFVVDLTSAVALSPATDWVSVQANQNFVPNGQWGGPTASCSRTPAPPGRTRVGASASA
jgi:hypothetical protein